MDNQLNRIVLLRNRESEANKDKYKANSKARLIAETRKRTQTIIFGIIARIEESFGHQWGHGKTDGEITDDERLAKDVWTQVRKAILDHGHSQSRALLEEFQQYEVEWIRHTLRVAVKTEEKSDEFVETK